MEDFNFHPNFAPCSVESLLSVPTQFIFRETQTGDQRRGGGGYGGNGGNSKKFIFSKSEVSTLLRVSMLSSEIDSILLLVYDALGRSHKCKAYRQYIDLEEANKDPASSKNSAKGIMLRALLPILDVHSQTSEQALSHATDETFGISRVLNELESCADDLGKFAEQNHTMADQLDCYMAAPAGHNDITLSDEKRAIAEIEEAIVDRIQNLSVLAMGQVPLNDGNDEDKSTSNKSENRGNSLACIGDLCENLLPAANITHRQEPVANVEISNSQMCAAEALQNLQSFPRG